MRRRRITPTVCLSFFIFSLVSIGVPSNSVAGEEAARHVGSEKIPAELRTHEEYKQLRADESVEDRARRLGRAGLSSERLDAEECALYFGSRPTAAQVASLAALGVEVNTSVWVPPVGRKHPHGFHTAVIPYAALDALAATNLVVRIESLEYEHEPQNNISRMVINAEAVHNGDGVVARTGAGAKIAIADSSLDTTHLDFPVPVEAYDMTDGTDVGSWGTDVSTTASDHGTHVAGSVLGRGTASVGNTDNGGGHYGGSAPGASLYFYKIGNDTNANASGTDEIEAIDRALAVGCDIFSMSYGGGTDYRDGSGAVCQAVDAAVSAGMAVFISAGNSANDDQHDSLFVSAFSFSSSFGFTIDNTGGGSAYTDDEWIRVIWRDGVPTDRQMVLSCSNLGVGEALTRDTEGSSSRDTEGVWYLLEPNVPAGTSKSFDLLLENPAAEFATVHCYASGEGTFDSPDSAYTVTSPAFADSAIAVAAWVHRYDWMSSDGTGPWNYGYTVDERAPFSSIGPRIDGVRKPEIASPGASTISARDSSAAVSYDANVLVDNDGILGSGADDYTVKNGTSMACPIAAGAAALVIEAEPSWSPAQVRQALTSTASTGANPNNEIGFGLIDVRAAIQSAGCTDFVASSGSPDFLDGRVSDFDGDFGLFQHAEEFNLAASAEINEVTFHGFYWDDGTLPATGDVFTIRIFAAPAGVVGVTPIYETIVTDTSRVDLDTPTLAVPTYRYQFAIPSVTLGAGDYAFSVTADTTGTSSSWIWSASDSSGQGWYRVNEGDAWTLGSGNDLAFSLSFRNPTTPENLLRNGDFGDDGRFWCEIDEGTDGTIDYSGDGVVITGPNDDSNGTRAFVQQTFTTCSAAGATISFDWSYTSSDSAGYDYAIWDVLDSDTGVSVVGGPVDLTTDSGTSGAVSETFFGNGGYTLILGVRSTDGCCDPGIATFDNVVIDLGNDECSGAYPVFLGDNCFSTVDATTSTDVYTEDPCVGTFLGEMFQDVWFTYTSPDTGTLTMTTCHEGTTFDTDLVVYEGSCGSLTQVACNGDETCAELYRSTLSMPVASGVAYTIRVGGWDEFSADAGVLNLDLCPALEFSTEPIGQTVCAGDTVQLTVAASGTGAVSYQWRRDGVELPGETSTLLSLMNFGPADVGGYDCVATDDCGAATSALAAVDLLPSLNISQAPVGGSVCDGDDFTLSLTASGAGTLSYQWRRDGVVVGPATGSSSYTIVEADPGDAGSYDCVVSDNCGFEISSAASVTVLAATVITTQPVGATLCTEEFLVLSVAGTGTGTLSYQWTLNGLPVGSNDATYTVPSATLGDSGIYQCTVTADCGSATSAPASVTVEECGTPFVRGDCNTDGGFDIADAVALLNFLFPTSPPGPTLACDDACDGNDDEMLNIADAIAILGGLFGSPAVPPTAPFPDCGLDPSGDALECDVYSPCW